MFIPFEAPVDHGVIMRRAVVTSLALVVLQLAVGFYLYPYMPDRMAIHWGISGEADGYGSRFLGLFLIPVVSALLFPFLMALPRLDPSGGLKKSKGVYDWFVFGFLAYMAYVQGLSVAWNLGWRFSFMRMLAPAMGVLSLSSEGVWNRTHEVGSWLFMVCGALATLGALTEGWLALALILVPVLFTGIYLVYYSYSEYHRLAVKRVD